MKTIIKITAILAVIIGLLTIVTGTNVLLGFFNPGYQYFNSLLIYNIIIGLFSVVTGILIWKRSNKAPLFSYIITGFHILVLLLLLIIFINVISINSVGAMAFRSILWIIISIVIWRANSKIKSD